MGAETLAERYARLAGEDVRHRRVDVALRSLDIAVSGFFLALFVPLAVVIALAIRLELGQPGAVSRRRGSGATAKCSR